jgi:hypothetical protein
MNPSQPKLLPKFRTASLADIELPHEIAPLREIAYNLWWTWNTRARRMFFELCQYLGLTPFLLFYD